MDPWRWYDREGNLVETEDAHGNILVGSMQRMVQLKLNPSYTIVAVDTVGIYKVSTIWLGWDQSFGQNKEPIIFETMIFGDGSYDEWCWRYSSEEDALLGHGAIVEALRKGQEPSWGDQ